jgi:CRISPR-associated protein Csx3
MRQETNMAKFFKMSRFSNAGKLEELTISFLEEGQTPQTVREAVDDLKAVGLTGGRLVKFYGAPSIPVAMALAHELGKLFGAVACYDPELSPGYVVCITHSPEYQLGQQLA